jgi:hypothetical protein
MKKYLYKLAKIRVLQLKLPKVFMKYVKQERKNRFNYFISRNESIDHEQYLINYIIIKVVLYRMQPKLKNHQQINRFEEFLWEKKKFFFSFKKSANLGTVFGVYLPCVQNIFGNRFFFFIFILIYFFF